MGFHNMLVTHEGTIYGERYGDYQLALSEYVRKGQIVYSKNHRNNPGRKKYYAGKARLEAGLHTYINKEINLLLKTETPKMIYIPKLPQTSKPGINKIYNNAVSMWQRGYIKNRLKQKCMQQSIELIEVFGKNISNECSSCGSIGVKSENMFICPVCGAELPERENAAKNTLKRGVMPQKDRFIKKEFTDI